MINPAIEEDLKRMSLNDVNYADYIKENYVPIEVLQEIRQEIEQEKDGYPPSADEYMAINRVIKIVDNHIKEITNEKCN